MRIMAQYSHLNGLEYLMVHKPGLWTEIQAIVDAVDATLLRTKISKEKGMVGGALYAPKEMNAVFKEKFELAGWSEQRTSYWVTDDANHIPIRIESPISVGSVKVDMMGYKGLRYPLNSLINKR